MFEFWPIFFNKGVKLEIVPVDQMPLAEDVPTSNVIDIFKIITKLEHLLIQKNGIGISAVQVGIPWKLFVIHRQNSIGKSPMEYYFNCEYEGLGEKQKSIEGCLSLTDSDGNVRRFEVERFSSVKVTGQRLRVTDAADIVVDQISIVENGLYAIVFQHEIDHQFQRDRMIDIIGKEIDIL